MFYNIAFLDNFLLFSYFLEFLEIFLAVLTSQILVMLPEMPKFSINQILHNQIAINKRKYTFKRGCMLMQIWIKPDFRVIQSNLRFSANFAEIAMSSIQINNLIAKPITVILKSYYILKIFEKWKIAQFKTSYKKI